MRWDLDTDVVDLVFGNKVVVFRSLVFRIDQSAIDQSAPPDLPAVTLKVNLQDCLQPQRSQMLQVRGIRETAPVESRHHFSKVLHGSAKVG